MSKNFSLLLALRYLNPLRTHVSVITLISLAGVSIGVMVLIVVMSVMDGFEDMVKDRVLGRAPHIVSYRVEAWDDDANSEAEWRGHMKDLKQHESVVNAYPLVKDFVLIDQQEQVSVARMRGLDSLNAETTKEFIKNVKEGDGDMGAGYVATVSDLFAKNNLIKVGDTISINSNRNLKQLKPLMDQNELVPVAVKHKEQYEMVRAELTKGLKPYGEKETMPNPKAEPVKTAMKGWLKGGIRDMEKNLIEDMLQTFYTEDFDEDPAGNNYYAAGTLKSLLESLDELKPVNIYRADSAAMKEVALPKDVEVVAIYRTDPFAPGPDLFVPISLAQELAGAGDVGQVQGIAITLKEPYRAQQTLKGELSETFNTRWQGVTWMEQHKQQFSILANQKSMMTIALSFIILIAVFSIGAVMFTITFQKKKEIGVMMALGATPGQITRVFTLQGVIVGVLGGAIGYGLARLVLWKLDAIQGVFASWGFNPFDKSFFGVEKMPYALDGRQSLAVCVGAFILCTLAALVPAWIASRADAAKSLRNM